MQSWMVGDVAITKIVELEISRAATWILPDATPERLLAEGDWLRPHFVDAQGKAPMSVHTLVLETREQRILVDSCIGNDKPRPIPGWNQMQGPFLSDLRAAGFPPESIDLVLCTHLHVDHVGWNTRLVDGKWVPTFPRARYLFAEPEFRYWMAEKDQRFGDVIGDSVRPVYEAGRVDLVQSNLAVSDEVRLEPTPGHTPGHVSVRISSRGEEAVITGDLMHHPVQCAHPEWASIADVDSRAAEATRRAFLARYGGSEVRVFGTHFAGPTSGHLVRDGSAWRLEV
jgi:glyoxylase-like metal-dependent hydrolase (beta-lactamase superfamily II)